VFSVGGGNPAKNVSVNLVRAVEYARSVGARVFGVVGRDGGYTAEVADVCIVVPTVNPEHVTAHTEGFQAVIWHLLVSHPTLKVHATKWEFDTLTRAGGSAPCRVRLTSDRIAPPRSRRATGARGICEGTHHHWHGRAPAIPPIASRSADEMGLRVAPPPTTGRLPVGGGRAR
jgi:hypothetical protein